MKIFTLLIALTASISALAQDAIVWEQEIIVSDGATYGNLRPRGTVVGNTPIVIYGGNGSENLFISRWNGTGFDTQSILPAGTTTYATGWTGADIASKGDTVVGVFKLTPIDNGNVYVVRSTDGGVTFSDTIRANNYSGGNAWMPSLEMDANGNPVIAMMIHDGTWGNPRYALAHSTDAGLSFDPIQEVTGAVPGEACDCCPSEIVTDNTGKEVLLYRNNESNIRDVYGILSIDGGQTYPYHENVDQLSWNISACPSTGVDGVIQGDDLYTVFASAALGIYRVYLSKSSTSGGLTYDTLLQVLEPNPTNGTQNYPRISAKNDTIVMAWEERINFNKEIYYAVSIPGMDPLEALSTYKFKANASSDGNQTNPDIIYKNGYVHLFYQDDFTGNVIYRRGQIDVTVGLQAEESPVVSLYPNPTNNAVVTVRNASEIKTVYMISGAKVSFDAAQKGKDVILNGHDFESGVYIITCEDALGRTKSLRWVVK